MYRVKQTNKKIKFKAAPIITIKQEKIKITKSSI
jgi:hypothetical protein